MRQLSLTHPTTGPVLETLHGALPDPSEPGDALAAVVALRRAADRLELAAVTEAIAQDWSWADVGAALGISRQAAHKRFATRIFGGRR